MQTVAIRKFGDVYRKTPALESLFNEVEDRKVCNFLKKRLQHWRFPVNIAKILRTTFFMVAASVMSSMEDSVLELQKYMRRIFKVV